MKKHITVTLLALALSAAFAQPAPASPDATVLPTVTVKTLENPG